MEEYDPQIKPTISGNENSRIDDTPKTNNNNTMIKVVIDVLILLDKVCVNDRFATYARASGVCFLTECRFSRIRSKMTMVSLTEYPTIVSIQAINVLPTEIRINA